VGVMALTRARFVLAARGAISQMVAQSKIPYTRMTALSRYLISGTKCRIYPWHEVRLLRGCRGRRMTANRLGSCMLEQENTAADPAWPLLEIDR